MFCIECGSTDKKMIGEICIDCFLKEFQMIEIPENAKLYETKTTTVETDGIIKVSVYIETIENVAIRG